MIRVVMLVTVILTATRVLAQERLVIGEGSTSCGAWTQARQAQSQSWRRTIAFLQFISSVNMQQLAA